MADIIYADPPWKQEKGGFKKARPNTSGSPLDYQTLGLEDIKEIVGKNMGKVLFLWTIDKYLFEAQKMGEDLGYKLHARLIWDKVTGIPAAFTVRFSHEYLLWMYTSPMIPISKDARGKFSTVFREKVIAHSKKPIKGYEMIEAMYPEASKLELFARNFRQGWESWGNQLPNSHPTSSLESWGIEKIKEIEGE